MAKYVYKLDSAGREAAKAVVAEWSGYAFRTGAMTNDERKIVKDAVEALYRAGGLTPPPRHRIVIAPSPMVARFAAGAAAWIWHCRKTRVATAAAAAATDEATRAATYDATYAATDAATAAATYVATAAATAAATDDATYDATYDATDEATDAATSAATDEATDAATSAATDAATYDATRAATYDATYAATDAATAAATSAATYDATYVATYAATYAATYDAKWFVGGDGAARAARAIAGIGGLKSAVLAYRFYQGGSAWSGAQALVAFGRDYIGLGQRGVISQEQYDKYAPWETLAKLSGFRFMHAEFCIVSDRPIEYHVDERNRPHCETGPFVRWADGSGFYSWRGVRVPARWIECRATLDPREVIAAENVEQRAAGAAIVGWPKMLSVLDAKVIDDSGSPDIGQLIELTLPGLSEPGRFLKAHCPRNGIIVEGVPRVSDIDRLPIETALAAQAWRIGDPQSEYAHPPRRT